MLKRIAFILLFVAVTVGFGYMLYRIIFGPAEPTVTPPTAEEGAVTAPGAGLPSARPGTGVTVTPGVTPTLPTQPTVSPIADGGLTQVRPVATAPTRSATLSDNGSISYYNRNDGQFYRMNPDGTVSALSDKKFFNVDNATFGPSGDQAVLEYPDGANVYYDFRSDRQVTLPKHWEEFDFSPQGDSIAAKSIGIDESNRFIVVSNPDGSGARPIQELGDNADKVQVDWSPNNQVVATAMTGQPYGVDKREVYFIGQNHENFRSMIVEGLNFQPKWSPDGEQLLYSAASSLSDWKPTLWLVDASGDNIGLNRRTLNVDTWANKCAFSGTDTLYCAVPQELPRGAGLQPAVADSTPDDIVKIDMITGLQTRVAIPEGNHTVDTLMISPNADRLYFTDKGSGMLNEVKLRP